ncbi:hypothetical protein DVH24_029457 [Malus domestica]|uniref:Uncharacterized protein n=1 Tax=Malus domestica TaxID=3750 RepID=A0A498HTG7_MALDO|nr:hypothetical protein DVH24_029457 [Malus domestica]
MRKAYDPAELAEARWTNEPCFEQKIMSVFSVPLGKESNTNSNRRMCWINAVYNHNHCSCKDTAHLVLNTYCSKSSLVLLKRRRLSGGEAAMASSSSSSAGRGISPSQSSLQAKERACNGELHQTRSSSKGEWRRRTGGSTTQTVSWVLLRFLGCASGVYNKLLTNGSSKFVHKEERVRKEFKVAENNVNVRSLSENRSEVELIASSIRGKLHQQPLFPACSCILRVPSVLRRHNKNAFVPTLVSIGPFHHGKENMQLMQEIKLWYLHCLLECFVEAFRSMEQHCRSCYGENLIRVEKNLWKYIYAEAHLIGVMIGEAMLALG